MKAIAQIICITLLSISLLSAQIDSLLTVLPKVSGDELIEVKLQLARAYLLQDLAESKRLALEIKELVEQESNHQAQLNDLLGRYYFYTSQLDSSAVHFVEARDYYKSESLDDKVALLGISIGSVYLRSGKYVEASETFIESASYFQSIGDQANLSKCYANLAAAMAEIGNLPDAIDYNQQAVNIMRQLNMSRELMIALPNLATQYLQNGDSTLSIQTYIEAERLALTADNKRSLALIYNNLGELYKSQGDIEKAKSNITKSINLKMELGQRKGLEEAYFNLAQIALDERKYDMALQYLNQALETMEGVGQIKIYRALSKVYEKKGNLSTSLDYERKAAQLDQEINLAQLNEQLNTVTEAYESAQKDNEILQLTAQNRLLEIAKVKNRSWGIIATVGFLGSLGIFYFLTLSNRRKQYIIQQRHIDEIKRKDDEIIERMIISQENERKRIAGDLHDSLGSKLATLKRFIEGLGDQRGLKPKAISLADESYQELRSISHSINSGVLTEKGLIPAIERMAENVSHSQAMKVEMINHNVSKRLPAFKEIQIFRILQEIITNAIKHSKGDKMTIKVSEENQHINIEVIDNGKGFDLDRAKSGIGLKSIQQRLKSIDADSDIESDNRGTKYHINVPV